MGAHRTRAYRLQRRGTVAVMVAIALIVIIGFGALSVDLGTLYSAQAELQRTADSAALAAAGTLVNGGSVEGRADAIAEADAMASMNEVLRHSAGVNGESDVEFGRAAFNAGTGKYTFQSASDNFDAIRVTVRRAEGSSGGPISLAFAGLFGTATRDLTARAAAVLVPRDMAVIVDLSGSMSWDSSLLFWDRTDGGWANTRDCWAALDGPEPARPYMPGTDSTTQYAGDTGPSIGFMTTWGNSLDPSSYSVSGDTAGLWQIRKGSNTLSTGITAALTAAGYTSDERTQLMSGSRDNASGYGNDHFRRRCAVMLGLASWRSGRAGGQPGGNGDAILDSSEVTYISYPSYRVGWTWTNYVDYVQTTMSGRSASGFRYKYGLKTFTHFLLEGYARYAQTNNLWATPELPQRAIKDAVQSMVDVITDQEGLDHLSLEVFATSSRHEVNLTNNYQSIADTLYGRQAAHYDNTTNIGAGLHQGIVELTSGRARPNAKKVMVILSDGLPNVDESGTYVGDGAAGAVNYARQQAQDAADRGWTIYTVSVGTAADRALMQEIAAIGGGVEFYAAGTPEEYTEQLQQIFRTLGGKRPVQLIE